MDNANPTLPAVAITMGDAAGIGPEIIVKALSRHPHLWQLCRPIVVGDVGCLERTRSQLGDELSVVQVEGPGQVTSRPGTLECIALDLIPADLQMGELSADAGEAAYRFVEKAAALAIARTVDAICTAPLNKAALHLAGHHYPGHTELLAALTGTEEVAMMLTATLPNGASLRVAHVTTHVGLVDAIERITPERVLLVIKLAEAALAHTVNNRRPRIAVCGINPHAGEGGLFGRGEERDKLEPAIAAAREMGIEAIGPLPADTAFFRAGRGDFDCVVAMYHDQGHAPVKVLGLEGGVNITLGLPIVRTSVDHGTAFDIAGKDMADERSLVFAIEEAARLSRPS